MRVAVLKPDHLGDLVLAAPAIAALQRRFDELTLLCHPESAGLADEGSLSTRRSNKEKQSREPTRPETILIRVHLRLLFPLSFFVAIGLSRYARDFRRSRI